MYRPCRGRGSVRWCPPRRSRGQRYFRMAPIRLPLRWERPKQCAHKANGDKAPQRHPWGPPRPAPLHNVTAASMPRSCVRAGHGLGAPGLASQPCHSRAASHSKIPMDSRPGGVDGLPLSATPCTHILCSNTNPHSKIKTKTSCRPTG